MVEGHHRLPRHSLSALPADLHNPCHGNLDLSQHHLGGHPQRSDVLRLQELGTPPIPLRLLSTIMHETIDFDSKPDGRAIEIEDVVPSRVLTTKFETAGPFS